VTLAVSFAKHDKDVIDSAFNHPLVSIPTLLRFIMYAGAIVWYFNGDGKPSRRFVIIFLTLSFLTTFSNFVYMQVTTDYIEFTKLIIHFIEALHVFQILQISFLYYTFDSYIEELMFEYVRDNVYRQSLEMKETFDESKIIEQT
jgi:hypothetical protein